MASTSIDLDYGSDILFHKKHLAKVTKLVLNSRIDEATHLMPQILQVLDHVGI